MRISLIFNQLLIVCSVVALPRTGPAVVQRFDPDKAYDAIQPSGTKLPLAWDPDQAYENIEPLAMHPTDQEVNDSLSALLEEPALQKDPSHPVSYWYPQPRFEREDWDDCYTWNENAHGCAHKHHCLRMPNGYATCVWERYHTMHQCVLPWKNNTEAGELECNRGDMCVRHVDEQNVAFCVSQKWLSWTPFEKSFWYGKNPDEMAHDVHSLKYISQGCLDGVKDACKAKYHVLDT